MKVLIAITTPTSHFPAGTEITADQLDGPMSVEDWQRIGHLEAPKPAKVQRDALPPPPPSEG